MPSRSFPALLALVSLLACGWIPGERDGARAPTASSPSRSASGRELYPPGAFAAGALELTLAEGERAAVFVLNAGGRDGAAARLSAANVAAPAASGTVRHALEISSPPVLPPGDAGVLEATRGAGEREVAEDGSASLRQPLVAAGEPPERTSFCVLADASYAKSARRPARRIATGASIAVYVDEGFSSELSDAEASRLVEAFDHRIHPALTALLGPPSDVDRNGRVILFLTPLTGVWGYFWANDVVKPLDASAACDGTRSNAADALYLAVPSSVTGAGFTRAQALDEILPGVVAHEYAHLLSYQRRCVGKKCSGWDETWIEEGVAKLAEDEAGYGWHLSRAGGVAYLRRTRGDPHRGYDGRSLTRWEGDSIGNYEGAHAFFRFHADRLGPELVAALASGRGGIASVEYALGTSFPEALADVATALLFSNTDTPAAEEFSFSGAAWTPFGAKLRPLETVPLGEALPAGASLRADGWNAFLTGPAGSGGGTVRIESDEAVKPWIAVVRFTGDL